MKYKYRRAQIKQLGQEHIEASSDPIWALKKFHFLIDNAKYGY